MTVVVAFAASGCATIAPRCTKIPITVAKKETQSRVEMRSGPPRTTVTGTMEQTQEVVPVVDDRVAAADGTWYRVTRAEYDAIAPGQRIDVCR